MWRGVALALATLGAFGALGSPDRPGPEWSPEPPVVGALAVEDFPRALPLWEHEAQRWAPAPDVVELLRSALPARIEVVFGSWCIDSFHHVPALLGALRAAANPELTLSLTGIDRRKQDPTHAAGRFGVVRVPTVIVLRQGRELGRVIETPATTLDRDVARILHVVLADAPERARPHEAPPPPP